MQKPARRQIRRRTPGPIKLVIASIALSVVLAGCQQFSFGRIAAAPTPTVPPATATRVPTAVPATATRVPTAIPATVTPVPTAIPATATLAPTAVPTAVSATATRAPAAPTPTAFVPAPQVNPPAAEAQPTPVPDVLTTTDQITQAYNDGVRGVPFELVISQDEIAQQITSYLQDNPDVAFSDLQVTLTPGAALVTGRAKVGGFSVPFNATVTVEVVDGKPRLKVLKLDVMGGLIPGFIKNQLISLIEQNADLPIVQDLPVTLTGVEIQQGQAVARGTLN